MRFKNIGIILLVLSAISFLLIAIFNWPNKLVYNGYLPLFFGIMSVIFFPKNIKLGPGMCIAVLVMILRYIVSPILFVFSNRGQTIDLLDDNSIIAIYLMLVEMLVIMIMIRIYLPLTSKKERFIETGKTFYFIPLLFLIISIFLSIIDPMPLSRYNFIFKGVEQLTVTDLDGSYRGLARFLDWTHKLLIVSVFYFFFKRYSKEKNNTFYLLLCFLFTGLLVSFYTDQSRNSMLLPLFGMLFLSIKAFNRYKKRILAIFALFIFLSMSLLSLVKFFGTNKFEKEMLDVNITYKLFDSYWGGYLEVLDGVYASDYISNKIDNMTFVNDISGSIIGFGFLDFNNRTTVYFNEYVGSNSRIIPTIVQGYSYFGILFFWILTFVIFRIIFILDKAYFLSDRVDMTFLYAFVSCSLAWMHPGNFTICTSVIFSNLYLYLILKCSSFIGSRFTFNK